MRTLDDLRGQLIRLDGRGYKAYKSIEGAYSSGDFELVVDHVQGDPFADPSRFRVRVPMSTAALPPSAFSSTSREIALRDFLARSFDAALRDRTGSVGGTGRSGAIYIDAPGQEILERSAVLLGGDRVEARFKVGLPARGRTIMGKAAARMIADELPSVVRRSLLYKSLDPGAVAAHVEAAEDQDAMRNSLRERGLVAFVADGSILPRRSGVDERPLAEGRVVAFESPASLRVTLEAPNLGPVTGMGVPEGVTLVVGGGFHGKSTLLRALELGVYNHLPGDGRERVVTRADAVKIRAEDGRAVTNVDISPFIGDLPYGRSTSEFSTENASGSTSQAANIIEALEAGSELLLIDEDTSATNFMIRDARMQRLVAPEKEPIRPLVDLAGPMFDELGVSTVIVMGGSGDYLDVASTVIMMDSYRPLDVTEGARAVARGLPSSREPAASGWPGGAVDSGRGSGAEEGAGSGAGEGGGGQRGKSRGASRGRLFDPASMDASRGRREKVSAKGLKSILFGRRSIDLSAVEQLVDESQTRAIGDALIYLRETCMRAPGASLAAMLDALDKALEEEGVDAVMRAALGDRARPRRYEVASALNRLRGVRISRTGD
jgi:predicted ABC-class ATPase